MEKFKSTLRLKTERIIGPNAVPYSENTTYFDVEKNILYKDFNGQRFAVAEVLKVDDLATGEYNTNQKRILNSIIINKNTVDDTFETYYAKEDGTIVLLGSNEGGGVIYSAGDGISISSENKISVDYSNIVRKQTENWIIENEEQNFGIREVDNSEDIITIYKEPQTTSGGVTDAKVEINAKTTISELDFGGW